MSSKKPKIFFLFVIVLFSISFSHAFTTYHDDFESYSTGIYPSDWSHYQDTNCGYSDCEKGDMAVVYEDSLDSQVLKCEEQTDGNRYCYISIDVKEKTTASFDYKYYVNDAWSTAEVGIYDTNFNRLERIKGISSGSTSGIQESSWSTVTKYDLSSYSGQTVYFGMRVNGRHSGDGFMARMKIDDLDITNNRKKFTSPQKYSWTVPDNAYKLNVRLWGAEGGKGASNPSNRRKGGYVEANYSVNGGETLNIRPGGVGGDAYTGNNDNVVFGGPGGFNGGGEGGNADKPDSTTHYGGGGGGGMSDIRIDGDSFSDQIFVAGGGGGNPGGGGTGGAGGANNGQNGEDNYGAGGGEGGTQNGGGSAGFPDSGDDSNQGDSGSRGSGGRGGYGENNNPAIGGGAGGAGYYGGGGGAGQAGGGESAGGGGGGSNYIVSSATALSNQRGVDANNNGDGKIIIKWYLNSKPDKPTNPDPVDNSVVQSDSTTISAEYNDPEKDPGTLYFFEEASNSFIDSCSVSHGGSCGVSWNSYGHGENKWYAVAGDGFGNTTGFNWSLIKNQAPTVNVLPVSPDNNTKTTTNDVWFNISVSDPDDDSLTVEYFTNQTGSSAIGSDTTPSGTIASHYETGLQRQKIYGWHVDVSDDWNTTSSNQWTFTVNQLPTISSPEPENNGAASGEPVNLSVQVGAQDSDDSTIYVDFYDSDDNHLGGRNINGEGRAWTEVPEIQIGETFKWYAEASDGDESIPSPIYEFTKTTGESYRTFTRIDYEYSAINMVPDSTRTLFFDIHNNVDYSKNLELYLEGVNAEFEDGSSTKQFSLAGEDQKRFRIDLKPESTGNKRLRIVAENKDIMINSTSSIPVRVKRFEAQGAAREVPGVTVLNILIIFAAGLLLYYRQL